jgi:hypothetical protein
VNKAARSLIVHNQRLLSVIRSGAQDEVLPELMQSRTERLLAFGAALDAGEKASKEEARELAQLERELIDSLLQRRDALAQELAALHRRRGAGRVYHAAADSAPQFVDRSG